MKVWPAQKAPTGLYWNRQMNPFTTNNARLMSDGQVVKTHEASLEILREVDAEIRSQFENMVPGEVLIPEGW